MHRTSNIGGLSTARLKRMRDVDNRGWGFGVSVFVRRDHLCNIPGRYGWEGGFGTSWYSDPSENLTGILLTQHLMDSPQMPPVMADFWTLAYQAIDD